MTLYLLKFNNYYNRIIKSFDTIEEYSDYVLDSFTNINFNPNDGINTEHVVNYYGEMPDYAIVVDEDNVILHRWFIIESQRTRAMQFKITLRRDIISDFKTDVIKAPTFIEKANVPVGDTAIFNNENMGFNQIKTSETLLKDFTRIPWIIGYLSPTAEGKQVSIPSEDVTVSATYSTLESYPYYKFNRENALFIEDNISRKCLHYNFYNTGWLGGRYVIGTDLKGEIVQPNTGINPDGVTNGIYYLARGDERGYAVPYTAVFGTGEYSMAKVASRLKPILAQNDLSNYGPTQGSFGERYRSSSRETIFSENEKIIQVENKYYKVHVNVGDTETIMSAIPTSGALGTQMYNNIKNDEGIDLDTFRDPVFEYEITGNPYYFELEEISIAAYTINIPQPSARPHLADAPYDMFAIPCGEIYLGEFIIENLCFEELGYKLAAAIQKNYTESELFDIQLVPFCPLDDNKFTRPSGTDQPCTLQQSRVSENTITPLLTSEDNPKTRSGLVWCTNSKFTKSLNYKITVPTDNIEFKVVNECDMYRLSSPNYASAFEFSATKNNGINGFRLDCQYKPINPYIRVAPLFNGLYGPIVDDARGLICGGDFSLSRTNNAWLNYELQNKNYQTIFDRQIENMEFSNRISRIQETWNIATGSLGAGIGGAMTGNLIGGAPGAGIGGVAGTGLSLAGGFADRYYNELIRSEALDYTKDNFGYQLGNIKALPIGLAKVSSFNPNNKIFPVLEYYTCTDVEKTALRNKIRYNGMTVMRIGTVEQFMQSEPTYIKGQLIRLEIPDDFHTVNEIANELNKGVFI